MRKPKLNINHKIAIKAAIAASNIVLDYFEAKEFRTQIKADNSPVTEADFAASKEIVKYLSETNLPILSEEEEQSEYAVRKNWKKLWIVDPLDGTKEFIKGTDEFCVCIGLVENSSPVFGVIAHPVSKNVYFGGKEIGSWKYNHEYETIESAEKLPLTQTPKNKLIVLGGKNPQQDFYLDFGKINKNYLTVEFQKLSSALKFCSMAEGTADIYPRNYPCMEWDTAAGHALIQGVGKDLYVHQTERVMKYNKGDLHVPFFVST